MSDMEFLSADDDNEAAKPSYRVPIGMPLRGEGRRQAAVASVLIHLLILALVLVPIVIAGKLIVPIEQGAGGKGPAGGGGGGNRGNDGSRETLQFVKVVATPVATPKTIPPITPVVPPPVKVTPPQVVPPIPQPEVQVSAPSAVQTVATIAGVGIGHDGPLGSGPGTGGGVGAGSGTGRGSGVGPGTGGGTQANYPPQPIEFFLPPLPPPSSVRGFKFIAEFDVDSTGKVLEMTFSETRDGNYNRRLAAVLHSMKFKPGTRPDGTPLRMKAQVGYEF